MANERDEPSCIGVASVQEDITPSRSTASRTTEEQSGGGFSGILLWLGVPSAPRGGPPTVESSIYESSAWNLLRRKSCPDETFTQIPHIQQINTWDCGIACLQMVLMWLRGADECSASYIQVPVTNEMERNALLRKVGTQSIWTVDLVMLLENLLSNEQHPNHQNTTYLFCSKVLGVNAKHSTTGYYEKAFPADSARLHHLCGEMSRRNVPLLCPYHLEFSQLIDLISNQHCVAILLVDSQLLCNEVGDNNARGNTYMGHYVVVCGISRELDHLLQAYTSENLAMLDQTDPVCIAVANPGISKPLIFVDPQKLERAWRADGTDSDVIFVAKHT